MAKLKVAYISPNESDISLTLEQLADVDHEFERHIVSSEGEIMEAVKGADLVINEVVPLNRAVIETMGDATAIVSLGHGFNHIDDEAATDMGVMLTNCAGYCSDEVANHAIMFLLALGKRLHTLDKVTREGSWDRDTNSNLFPMPGIYGQTIGLIGFGNIGRPTSRKAKAFGLDVLVYDPYLEPWVAEEYEVTRVNSMEALAAASDYVSMHVPLNEETRGLASDDLFKAMKPTAFFINTCRGPTQDEAALIRALNAGEIAGAGLDVFEVEPTPTDNPLLAMENVIVTPHSAGASDHSNSAGRTRLGEEAARILNGMYPMSLVNPDVARKIPTRQAAKSI